MSVAFAKSAGWLDLVGTSRRDAEVWEIDPSNGTLVVTNPVIILTPVKLPGQGNNMYYSSSDGFAVLTNEDFLVNDYDGAAGGAIYREYYGFNAPAELNLASQP